MVLTIIAYIIAFFFAMNIGASGTAAAMGPAYGSGAIRTKRKAIVVVAVFAFLGAMAGGEVVRTIGRGIIPVEIVSIEVTIFVLTAACLTLFIANMIGIPLSTSQVVVGSLVGAGLAYQALLFERLIIIISFWMIVPIVAFTLSIVFGIVIKRIELKCPYLEKNEKQKRFLILFLLVSGALQAYAAGMNNVANAVGPLVGAGLIDVRTAVIVGGIFVSIGGFILGGKVLETNGKKITRLTVLQAIAVSLTCGSLVIVTSTIGLPVPLTQVTTSSIIGIGVVNTGLSVIKKDVIKKVSMVWLVSPFFSLALSYGLITLFLNDDLYTSVVLVGVFYRDVRFCKISTIREKGKKCNT